MMLGEFVRENNAIEGILREPTGGELDELARFVRLGAPSIRDLVQFVSVYQPNAKLRDAKGLNVRVGSYIAPNGGPAIVTQLNTILSMAHRQVSPFTIHVMYENLHPFTDGNGRSGRALWLWQMVKQERYSEQLLFLHRWYYQSLEER